MRRLHRHVGFVPIADIGNRRSGFLPQRQYRPWNGGN